MSALDNYGRNISISSIVLMNVINTNVDQGTTALHMQNECSNMKDVNPTPTGERFTS